MVDTGDGHLVILFLIVTLTLGIVSRHVVLHYHVPLPYTVILLISGLLLGLLTRIAASSDDFILAEEIVSHMNPSSIAYIFLPALLFEGAFNVDYRTLSHLYLPVFLLAVPAVILTSLLITLVVYSMFDYRWDWLTALVFGAILSATDPVAVVANLKEMGASRRLSTIIEAESMLNDGVAYVLYTLFFDLLLSSSSNSLTDPNTTTSINVASEVGKFAQNSLGGPLWGLALGIVTVTYLASIADFELEITLTVLSAYACYYLAQASLGVSGVLAVVIFGLYLSKWRKNSVSPAVQSSLSQIWQFLSYISTTVIFVLTGVIVAESLFVNSSIRGVDFPFALLLYVFLHIIRALVVLILSPIIRWSGYELGMKEGVVLVWSGLRGSLSLILGLLTSLATEIDQTTRDRIGFHVAAIVLLTNALNGSTSKALVRWFRLDRGSKESRAIVRTAMLNWRGKIEGELQRMKESREYMYADWREVEKAIPVLVAENAVTRGGHTTADQEAFPNSPRPRRLISFASLSHLDLSSQSLPVSRADHAENLRRELIRRFLSVQASEYESQYSQGAITQPALNILLAATGAASDAEDLSIQWKLIETHFRVPFYLTYLYRSTLMRSIPFVSTSIQHFLFLHFALSIELSISILTAQSHLDSLIHSFPELESVDSSVFSEVKKQTRYYQRKILQSFADIRRSFPEAFVAVQNRQAIMNLLRVAREQMDNMHYAGLLDEIEWNTLRSILLAHIEKVQHSSISGRLISSEVSFLSSPYMNRLPNNVQQQLLMTSKRCLWQPGSLISEKGKQAEGIHFIVRGIVATFFERPEEARKPVRKKRDKTGLINPSSDRHHRVRNQSQNGNQVQLPSRQLPSDSTDVDATGSTDANANAKASQRMPRSAHNSTISIHHAYRAANLLSNFSANTGLSLDGSPIQPQDAKENELVLEPMHQTGTGTDTTGLPIPSVASTSSLEMATLGPESQPRDPSSNPVSDSLNSLVSLRLHFPTFLARSIRSTTLDAGQDSQNATKANVTEKSGLNFIVDSYSCLTRRASLSTVKALTTVETFFVPLSQLELILQYSAEAELFWRMTADELIKARFLDVLQLNGVEFVHVTAILARASFHLIKTETRSETASEPREWSFDHTTRILLLQGEIDLVEEKDSSAQPESDSRLPGPVASNDSMNGGENRDGAGLSNSVHLHVYPPSLVQCSTGGMRCRLLSDSVFVEWHLEDELAVKSDVARKEEKLLQEESDEKRLKEAEIREEDAGIDNSSSDPPTSHSNQDAASSSPEFSMGFPRERRVLVPQNPNVRDVPAAAPKARPHRQLRRLSLSTGDIFTRDSLPWITGSLYNQSSAQVLSTPSRTPSLTPTAAAAGALSAVPITRSPHHLSLNVIADNGQRSPGLLSSSDFAAVTVAALSSSHMKRERVKASPHHVHEEDEEEALLLNTALGKRDLGTADSKEEDRSQSPTANSGSSQASDSSRGAATGLAGDRGQREENRRRNAEITPLQAVFRESAIDQPQTPAQGQTQTSNREENKSAVS